MKALIVVDLQNDFIDGAIPVPRAHAVATDIAYRLIPDVKEGCYVVSTQDWHVDPGDHFTQWPVHCVAGSTGAQMAPQLTNESFDAHFLKGEYSAAYSGFEGRKAGMHTKVMLTEWLRSHKVTKVDIVGLALDHCVKATALDAQKLGFTTRVLRAYTAATSEDAKISTLAELTEAGVEVV